MSDDVINYEDIAEAIWTEIQARGSEGQLTLFELDTILKGKGLPVASRGAVRRDTWNYRRRNHRKNFNHILRRKHGVTLEVVAGGMDTVYGLVPIGRKVIGQPVRQIESFFRRVRRPMADIEKAFNEMWAPPPGLDAEGVKRWHHGNAEFFRSMSMAMLHFVENNTRISGYADHMPDLPELPEVPRVGKKGPRLAVVKS